MYKVGIFGTGPLTKIHIETWKEIPGVSIVGFFVPDPNLATLLESTFALPRYTSEEELIRDCDLADVVYDTPARFTICEKAIRKGRHLFVPNPIARTMGEAEQLVKLVQESNVKLQVGHTERFNPAFLSLKKEELNPMFIEGHRLVAFQNKGREADVLFDLMIHDIDLVLSLVKSEVKQVSANGVAVMTDTMDIVNARIAFNNGCVANLTASRIETCTAHKMRLFQKDAYIELDYQNTRSKMVRGKESEENALSSFNLETSQDVKISPLRQELEEFLKAVRNNTRTVVNEIDGYRAMEVAHQILQKITPNFATAP